MGFDWAESRRAYHEAADWFCDAVATVGDRWAQPGLGEWDVRALVGHASRSFVTVESHLGAPAASVEVESAVAYYLATSGLSAGPGVAQRGRDAGAALGDDPAASVAALASRVSALVDGLSGDELPTTIVGGMRLRDYLPTRVLELTVHTADLCRALGVSGTPPALPATLTLRLLGDLAVARGEAGTLLLGATGRGLPAGFTVL